MKNILLLGNKGMLGRYFQKYMQTKSEFNVLSLSRDELDAETATVDNIRRIINENNIEVIINCVGMIKPQIAKYSMSSAIKVNSLFPYSLSEAVEGSDTKVVHITTDCVYSGDLAQTLSYNEDSIHDVEDDYGLTKFLGEPDNVMVLRTSIIGEEVGQQRSLIEWLKSNKGGEVNGFLDHHWNGVTCLQLAKIVCNLIDKNDMWIGKRHVHSNTVNKFELLNIINDAFSLDLKVNKVDSGNYCNRSLSTKYSNINTLNLVDQLQELAEFNEYLYEE